MNNEIGHLDLADRQLLATGAGPRKSLSKEIGEATITHTIFGRAKVRIIRKHDNIRRSLWWIVLAVLLVLVALQAWFAWQQMEIEQNEGLTSVPEPAMQQNMPDPMPQPVIETTAPPQPAAAVAQPQPVAPPVPVFVPQSTAPKAVPASGVATQVPAQTPLPKLQSASAPVVVVPRIVKPAPRPVVKPVLPAAASGTVAAETLSSPVQAELKPQMMQDSEPQKVENPKPDIFNTR